VNLCAPISVEEKSYKELTAMCEKHYKVVRTEEGERINFRNCKQKPNQTISEFSLELKKLIRYCNYRDQKEALKETFLAGMCNQFIRTKVMADCTGKDFETCVAKAQDIEKIYAETKVHLKEQAGAASAASASVNCIDGTRSTCYRCTGDHDPNRCRFKGTKCFKCQRIGHIGKACFARKSRGKSEQNSQDQRKNSLEQTSRGRQQNSQSGNSQWNSQDHRRKNSQGHRHKNSYKTRFVDDDDDYDDDLCTTVYSDWCAVQNDENDSVNYENDDDVELYTVHSVVSGAAPPVNVEVFVNNQPVKFIVDTGANVSIISNAVYENKFADCSLRQCRIKLKGYSGKYIPVVGEFDVLVEHHGQSKVLPLVVADGADVCLLGRNWMSQIRLDWARIFNVITSSVNSVQSETIKLKDNNFKMRNPENLDKLLEQYKDVFSSDQGTIKDFAAQIHVQSDATPRFFKPRPVPYALKEAVEKELDRLEKAGVIKKVSRSDWASPIVVVPKRDNSVRVCGDYKVTINPVLQEEVYPLPTAEDLFAKLHGGKIFSKIDLTSAYLQLEVDNNSKKFLTINTHKGLYQYQRLSFGVSTAPLIFQRVMDQVLQGLDHVVCSQDDILIESSDEKTHVKLLNRVLQRLSEYHIKAKPNKSEFFKTKLCFLGHVVDQVGLHPDESKVNAIAELRAPQNVKELQTVIGIVNYYGKFLPFQANLMRPLYELLRKEVSWKWTKECQTVLDRIKALLTTSAVLVHYDPARPITVACDASPYGVGAVLSHIMDNGEERPVAYASRTLTSAERKFHKYVYGRKFTLITDHKPLVNIFGPKTGVPTLAAQRLQGWALILMAHQYDIQYRKSADHANCDTLSRLPLDVQESDAEARESPIYFASRVDDLPVTARDIASATRTDPVLSKVYELTLNGWPDSCKDDDILPYFRRKHELSIDQGCVLWGVRVIIPAKYREKLVEELHTEHPGIVRMKACAHSYFWYPSLDGDIENKVKSCGTFQAVQNKPPGAPLIPWMPSGKVWDRIHIDFADYQQTYYLIIVCAPSKWLEAVMMKTITSEKTIRVLKAKFAQFGIPEEIVSDNGPQLTSQEFEDFLRSNGIKHTLVPPYHPASNGQAERCVATVKLALKKHMLDYTGANREDRLNQFLLMYRTTPHSTTGRSPAEIFLKRRPRTRFDLLKPDLRKTIQDSQAIQKKYHDQLPTQFREFAVGEIVRVKNCRNGVETFVKGVETY
jgi:hypothetical protein